MKGTRAIQTLDALVAEVEAGLATEREIDRFLSGESDGSLLLNALYGDAFDEPIPDRLLAVLREGCK